MTEGFVYKTKKKAANAAFFLCLVGGVRRYKSGAPLMIYTARGAVIEAPSQSLLAPAPPGGSPTGDELPFFPVRLISASPSGRGGGAADGEGTRVAVISTLARDEIQGRSALDDIHAGRDDIPPVGG